MQNTLSETAKQKIMTVIGNNPSKSRESEIQKEIVVLFFQVIESFAKKADYEIKNVAQHFICFFMAHFAAAKNAGALKADFLFKNFLESKDQTTLLFLSNICLPQCANGNADAIEAMMKISVVVDEHEIDKKVDALLIKIGKNINHTEIVLNVIRKYLPTRHSLLETCLHIDKSSAYEFCVQSIADKSSADHKKTALNILSSMPLGHGQLRHIVLMAGNLLTKAYFADDWETRKFTYALIAKAAKTKALEKSEAATILQEAFNHESMGHGLEELIALVRKLDCDAAEDIIFQGLLRIETGKPDNRFTFRDKVVKNFLQELSPEHRSFFLQKAIAKSQDDDFLWYACKELLVCDTIATATKTLERAIKNGSQEKIGVITRFALSIRDKTTRHDEGLEKIPKVELEKLAQKVLGCTKARNVGAGFEIAKNAVVNGGKPADIKNVLPTLHSIALNCDKNFAETVHLLLICASDKEKKVDKEAQEILDDLLEKKRQELLEVLIKLLKRQWNWSRTCLTISSINFLTRHKITEVMPEVTANFKSSWSDNGINHAGVRYFSQLSLAGSTEAINILTSYESSNVLSDTIPKELVAIYNKTSADKIRQAILEGMRRRFVASIHKNSYGLRYLSELAAIEQLKAENGVFDIYLSGIKAIGEASYHSAGMDNIIKKASLFADKKSLPKVKALIGPMMESLEKRKNELSIYDSNDSEERRAIAHITQAATEFLIA